MTKTAKLPFKLDTITANQFHYIPVIPENNHWLIFLRNNGEEGKKLGQKFIDSLLKIKTENESGEFDTNGTENPNCAGLIFEKWHGLLQEERQILKSQIENFYSLRNEWDKFVSTSSNELGIQREKFEQLIDNPYEQDFELGKKIEEYHEEGKRLSEGLFNLNNQLNDDAISVVISKRFGIDWTTAETNLLHPKMKQAISDFISNERLGWEESQSSDISSQLSKEDEGEGI